MSGSRFTMRTLVKLSSQVTVCRLETVQRDSVKSNYVCRPFMNLISDYETADDHNVVEKYSTASRRDETSNSTDSVCVCVCVRGWRCRGDAVTQGVSPEWKQRLPTAGFHAVSPCRPRAQKNFVDNHAHTFTVCACICVYMCVCGRCWLYLKPV